MSKRGPLAQINAHQANILDALRDASGPLTLKHLQAVCGLARTMTGRLVDDLRLWGLVDEARGMDVMPEPTKGQSRKALLFTINASGRRALGRFKRELEAEQIEVVPPARNSLFEADTYVPNSQAFYRNTGNKHIASRGFQC